MSSLENSDDHTSATEWSKDNLKVKWKASASLWLEEIWQGRRNWYEVHLPPEETITKDVPHAETHCKALQLKQEMAATVQTWTAVAAALQPQTSRG